MQMRQEKVQVLWNRQVAAGYFRMGLNCHSGYSNARPGQFIMLRPDNRLDPLLRRPFSIHQLIVQQGSVVGLELLYRVVGRTTRRLGCKQPGDRVDIMGPLGHGFSLPGGGRHFMIVAGGIGVAPMLFLVSYLQRNRMALSKGVVFLGGRSQNDLLSRDDFASLGIRVQVSTDDGSCGQCAPVTDLLQTAVGHSRPDMIYACGPMAMLACVAGIADKHGIACQVSVETMMACGMGACLGCAIKSRKFPERYLHACRDGPVFNTDELVLAQMPGVSS